MIYFTSDLHLGHDKPFLWEKRGFPSIKVHDEIIVKNWNEIVKPDDIVYVLGDLMLCDNDAGIQLFQQLAGIKKIVLGNHDTTARIDLYASCPHTVILGYADVMKYTKHRFYISHYPTLTANFDDYKNNCPVINLHGHTHSSEKFEYNNPFIYNVALDAHDMKPVSVEEILKDIQNKKKEMIENNASY